MPSKREKAPQPFTQNPKEVAQEHRINLSLVTDRTPIVVSPENPVTQEWIDKVKEAEDNTIKKIKENPENMEQVYQDFYFNFLRSNYLNDEQCTKYPLLAIVNHFIGNVINQGVQRSMELFKKEHSNNLLEKVIGRIRLTTPTFKSFNEFYNSSEHSLSEIFQESIEFAQAANTHKIIVIGEKLISKLGKPNVMEKSNYFIIFSTLLENAQKYSPEGSVITVEISKKRFKKVIMGIEEKEDEYYLSVSDEGIGIPPEDQKRILEKGQRGSNVGEINGTGFGLSLIYALCYPKPTITSPLYPNAEKYKGTKITVQL